MTSGSRARAASARAWRCTSGQPSSAVCSAAVNGRHEIRRASGRTAGSAVKSPSTSLMRSQRVAPSAVASSTADQSDPPRPSVTIRWSSRATNPGTTTIRWAASAGARRPGARTRPSPPAARSRPVSCTARPVALAPRARRRGDSSATDRVSPVDQSRSSSAAPRPPESGLPGPVAPMAEASSRRASVWPNSAETTTTKRACGSLARRATRCDAAAA